ncbi:MAG: transposase [candidate division WOR-3 bacterium]|nr:transposase [candidate division WOR-3 bacterium]
MIFEELTDEKWKFIEPYLPTPAPTGRPRADDRKTINGILFVLITGCKWTDMPKSYGSPVTAWRRLRNWEEKEVWSKLMQQLKNEVYRAGKISVKAASIDSKTVVAKKGASASDTTAIKRRKAQRSM